MNIDRDELPWQLVPVSHGHKWIAASGGDMIQKQLIKDDRFIGRCVSEKAEAWIWEEESLSSGKKGKYQGNACRNP